MNADGKNVYHREKLYEEVWNAPVTQVAKSYGVSDVAIHKICKSMNIPTPPKGYWAKLKFGKEVNKVPLPPDNKSRHINIGINPNNGEIKTDNSLSFLNDAEQEKIISVALSLIINSDKNLCTEIRDHQKVVTAWNSKHDSIEGTSYTYSKYVYKSKYSVPVLAGVISKTGLIRAYKIINCIIEGLKHLGYSVNDDMSFCIRDQKVKFSMYESQNYVDHVITPKEEKDLQRYEKAMKSDNWAIKPFIAKRDNCFNGKLVFNTIKNIYIRDTDKCTIEDRLPDLLDQLVMQSEIVRNERLIEEEKSRKFVEEKRNHELFIDTYNHEIDKLDLLLNEASDFEIATKIRDYVCYVQHKDIHQEKTAWISWANEKADWYDPTVDKNDSIFGKRNHNVVFVPKKKEYRYW